PKAARGKRGKKAPKVPEPEASEVMMSIGNVDFVMETDARRAERLRRKASAAPAKLQGATRGGDVLSDGKMYDRVVSDKGYTLTPKDGVLGRPCYQLFRDGECISTLTAAEEILDANGDLDEGTKEWVQEIYERTKP